MERCFILGSKSRPPWDDEEKALRAELRTLREEQRAAIEVATYISMDEPTAQAYERRGARIIEIQRTLGLGPEASNEW